MAGLFKRPNDPVRQLLTEYVNRLATIHTAQQLVITLSIVHEQRIKPILKLTLVNQQLTSDEVPRPWQAPTDPQSSAITLCQTTQSKNSKSLCVPITVHDGQGHNSDSESIGLLSIESTNHITAAQRSNFEGPTFALLDGLANQSIYEMLKVRALSQWQREVMQTLQDACHLDYVAHDMKWVYQQVLDAAFIIAPLANVGHIMTVRPDPLMMLPTRLRLTFAAASTRNRPTGKLEVTGTYPETEQYEYGIDDGVTGQCVKDRTEKYHPNLKGVVPFKTVYEKSQSEICFPLIVGGQIMGVLNLESEALAAFSESDRNCLRILAHELALIMYAKSDIQTRMSLLERGLHTFPTILSSLDTPGELPQVLMEWSSQLGAPPFDYACFIPEHDFSGLTPDPSGVQPFVAGLTVALQLKHDSTPFGTLVLISAIKQEALMQQATALQTLEPVFSEAFYGVLTLWQMSDRDMMARFGSRIDHTIHNLRTSFESGPPQLPNQPMESIHGGLKCLKIIGDIIAHGPRDASERSPDGAIINVVQKASDVVSAQIWRFGLNGITLTVDPPMEGLFPHIRGHHSTFQWALMELLDNALKYSKAQNKSHVKLTILWYRGYWDVLIKVEDQCERIPAMDKLKIWLPHTRGSQTGADTTTGTGQGLAIVDWCVNTLKGSRNLEDSDLGGNCFILKFPVIDRG